MPGAMDLVEGVKQRELASYSNEVRIGGLQNNTAEQVGMVRN